MFHQRAAQCIDDLKGLARISVIGEYSYCQRLTHLSKEFGFNNFHHFREVVEHLSEDLIGNISTTLMRRYCEVAQPKPGIAYFEFLSVNNDTRLRFYSQWAGWDEFGQEVRVPRSLNGESAPRLRKSLNKTVYIVENDRQLIAWRHRWHGLCYISEELCKNHMKEAFERNNAIVGGKRNEEFPLLDDFSDNYATWYPVIE
ncbi:hypothetical protein [Pseudomonas syringae]